MEMRNVYVLSRPWKATVLAVGWGIGGGACPPPRHKLQYGTGASLKFIFYEVNQRRACYV